MRLLCSSLFLKKMYTTKMFELEITNTLSMKDLKNNYRFAVS